MFTNIANQSVGERRPVPIMSLVAERSAGKRVSDRRSIHDKVIINKPRD